MLRFPENARLANQNLSKIVVRCRAAPTNADIVLKASNPSARVGVKLLLGSQVGSAGPC